MQNITVICIGKLKESYWRDACAEYSKRLVAFCNFSIIELPAIRIAEKPSAAEIKNVLIEEGKAIISKIPKKSAVFSLCIEGTAITSESLAQETERAAVDGMSGITFIIGGSHGLSEDVKKISDKRISMSKMTFPHQLARVMLCEQIYRAFSIINDGKYHK